MRIPTKIMTIIVLAALMLARAGVNSNAAVLVFDDIQDTSPGASNPYYNTNKIIVIPNISASGIGHGSGIETTLVDNRYPAIGWTTSAYDPNDYFTFTLTANSGYELNFTSFEFHDQRNKDNVPTFIQLRSSVDNFGAPIASINIATNRESNVSSPVYESIDLTNAAFQHLTGPVEFRLYGYSSTGAGLTAGNGTYSINNYQFNGTASPTPEPKTWMLLGTGSLLIIWQFRRKRNPALLHETNQKVF